jgi:hypothetical protein
MKTEKLTLQDCFKYPKAKIKDGSIIWDNLTNFIMEESELHHDLDWKLILRPKSSLTDEENKKLVMLLGDIDGNGNETLSIPAWDIYRDDIITMDYMRSINIDIDGLKERGLCIYE